MKEKINSRKILTDYYETARKSLIAKMELESEDQINLKIKIATFVIYELTHSTPSWFKNYFLLDININNDDTDPITDKKILKVESAFFNVVADYLISLESEIDYVKQMLETLTEWQKKDFWKPVVSDAFLLAGIYFSSPLTTGKNSYSEVKAEQLGKMNTRPYLYRMLNEGSVVF